MPYRAPSVSLGSTGFRQESRICISYPFEEYYTQTPTAQDGDKRFFCYANSDLRKEQQNDEILRFVEFWKKRTGKLPEELIFDSKLTTYANLNKLNRKGIQFITLRRRTAELVRELEDRPASAWRRIELEGVSRIYRTPRILDERVSLTAYEGPLRQIAVTDLGHEEPTLLLTNQLSRSTTTP
ncbi:MAG: hypothetical protein ACLQNE_06340 [Thermoguttaceae bacterium]